MNLANIRISKKIFSIVGLLSLVAATISVIAVINLETVSKDALIIEHVAQEVRVSAHMSQNVIELNRAEYRLASDPSQIDAVIPEIEKARAEFEEGLKKAAVYSNAEQLALLERIKTAYAVYRTDQDRTLEASRRHVSDVTVSAGQAEILEHVAESVRAARTLEQSVEDYVAYAGALGERVAEEAHVTAVHSEEAVVAIAVVGILCGAALGWVIATKGTVNPLRRSVAGLRELAEGNLDVDIFGADRRDEVGEIARTLQVFKDTAIAARRMEEEQKEAERRAAAEKRAAMLALADNLESATGEVLEILSASAAEMEATAGSMSSIAEETSRQSGAVAAAAEEASTNVETVASAAEELSTSVHEIGRQVERSTEVANQAVENVQRTDEQVRGLAEAAEKIGEVIGLITEIANQTNLLALNATIEAARAGEAGKGFAVVASEVKSLATQTARATEDISQYVGGIQGATRQAVEAIQSITATIGEVGEIATSIAAAVEQQGLATQEIARNVSEASEGTKEVTRNIAGVNTAAAETGAAATQVLATSGELSRGTTGLKSAVEEFLRTMRAA